MAGQIDPVPGLAMVLLLVVFVVVLCGGAPAAKRRLLCIGRDSSVAVVGVFRRFDTECADFGFVLARFRGRECCAFRGHAFHAHKERFVNFARLAVNARFST